MTTTRVIPDLRLTDGAPARMHPLYSTHAAKAFVQAERHLVLALRYGSEREGWMYQIAIVDAHIWLNKALIH